MQVLKTGLSLKDVFSVIQIHFFFQEIFRNKTTYMVIAQKWVMLSVWEEKSIFAKAGENNWSVSDEGKSCVSFSIGFFQTFLSFSAPFLILSFLFEFYWLYFQLIYSALFFHAVSFPLCSVSAETDTKLTIGFEFAVKI